MNHTTRRATRSIHVGAFDGCTLPARHVTWTRPGSGMGHTNTAAKRAAIRAAVERMPWRARRSLQPCCMPHRPGR
jgi:hypothetical protein